MMKVKETQDARSKDKIFSKLIPKERDLTINRVYTI